MQIAVENFLKWVWSFPSFVQPRSYFDILIKNSSKNISIQHKLNIHNLIYKTLRLAAPFIEIAKIDGLLYCRLTDAGFDLINDLVKFQPPKYDIPGLSNSCNKFRKSMIFSIQSENMFDPDLRIQNQTYFKNYLDNMKDKYLVFKRYQPKRKPSPGLVIPLKVRFTDRSIIKKTLDKFDFACDLASTKYKSGVFLTLTTDPYLFNNIWDANRHFSKAWNKFLSYLTKRFGFRPKYIASYEYTKDTGLMHMHAIIFGVSWLADHSEITAEWQACGQGKINYEYVIHYNNDRWEWTKKEPANANYKSPTDYLKKYIKKALYDISDHDLFWLFNKRFLTCSRDFSMPFQYPPSRVCLWKYIGTWSLYDVPDLIFDNCNQINYFMEVCKT